MDPVRERFAKDYGMPAEAVTKLVRLADKAKKQNEHACNGDFHYNLGQIRGHESKAQCSEYWQADLEVTTQQIADLAIPYGFTAVEYTGLRPCLKRGEQFVEIPA